MRRKIVIVILLILVSLGGLRIYNAPEENEKFADDLEGVMEKGHRFSWLLFIGNKWLLNDFHLVEPALSKMTNASIDQVLRTEIVKKYEDQGGKFRSGLLSVLFAEPQDIVLVALERKEHYIVMTFALKESLFLPKRKKMLYSVAFRYYQPTSETLWKRTLRKTANAIPLCSSLGTTGEWLIVNYGYTYNQSDYASWYLREGDAHVRKGMEETKYFFDRLRSHAGFIETEVAIAQKLSEEWAIAWVKKQIEDTDE